MAVEKERAIADNELQNQIELAVREENLIAQQGRNERRRVEEEASAEETSVKALIARERMQAEAIASKSLLEAESSSESQRKPIRSGSTRKKGLIMARCSALFGSLRRIWVAV